MLFLKRNLFISLFSLFFILQLCFAFNKDLFDYHSIDMNLNISNGFGVASYGDNFFLDSASATLSWFPREDYRQEVSLISTSPRSEFDEVNGFTFNWDKPSQSLFSFAVNSEVSTTNDFVEIKNKVVFPIKDLDPSLSEYLVPQEIIDFNDDIKALASNLVDSDDQYKVVVNIASWVEDNIFYNLSTITADATQKSSWVLNNRQGVCDELTSLFISLCRSLGIPARFVTGLSYSNVNLANDGWGPHGWAEVYFPGEGWVPFDVTYKQLGYLDATHIKLKTSLDAKETSTDYSIRAAEARIVPGTMNLDVEVTGYDYKIKPYFTFSTEVAEKEVGFGSYNLLITTVRNPLDYYLTTRLYVSNVTELFISGDKDFDIVLAPGEEKKFYTMFKVNSELNPDYFYTFPLHITGSRNENVGASFKAVFNGDIYSEEYIKSLIPEINSKDYQELKLECSADKQQAYINETIIINCSVKNSGSADLKRLQICLDKQCVSENVPSDSLSFFDYSRTFDTIGVKTLVFRAENYQARESYYVIIRSEDEPLINIVNVSYPESLNYDDASEIRLRLSRESNNKPSNIKLSLEHELINQDWIIKNLDNDYEARFLFKGSDLKLNNNKFNIVVSYQDSNSKRYTTEKSFTIRLANVTFMQRLNIWLNILDKKLSKWIEGI